MPEIQNIIASFANAPGFDTQAFLQAHDKPAVNSFRINRKKIDSSPFPFNSTVPWCDDGFYLTERAKYAQHPFWHGGAFYVQEASSMFLHHVLKTILPLDESLVVLDACAAPGGKSTLIASLLNSRSVLVSNEVIRSRVNVLQENIIKWGNANSIITSCDTQQLGKLPPIFDCIVIDAPCSGSGLFRKDPNSLNEWSESNVQLCGERQQRILNNLIPTIKDNGFIVYCTCSFSTSENEDMVEWLCKEHQLERIEIGVPETWNIVNSGSGCYRFYPNRLEGEGFFLSIMRKKVGLPTPEISIAKSLKIVKPEESFTKYLDGEFHYFMHNDSIFAVTDSVLETTEILRQFKINLMQCGIEVGAQKANKFIPAHALALNDAIASNLEIIEVDELTAMNYLRKNTISIESSIGYKLLSYQGVKLGWVNIIQNRTNNLYPTHWRLLH